MLKLPFLLPSVSPLFTSLEYSSVSHKHFFLSVLKTGHNTVSLGKWLTPSFSPGEEAGEPGTSHARQQGSCSNMDGVSKGHSIHACSVAQSCLTLCNPIRLLCLQDSPAKNTGVGCHFLQGILPTQGSNPHLLGVRFFTTEPPGKPKRAQSDSESCSVMSDSLRPHGLYMESSRPEYWSGQPFPSPGDLPNPGIEPRSPSLQEDSLPAKPQEAP